MEHFKESLAHYRLGLVVPWLFESPKVEGTLRVERGAVLRHFYFREGALVGESSSVPTEHLGQVLVHLRILTAARAAAAFEAAESAGMPFGTFLVQHGLVGQPQLVEALEHKAREALFDSYGWESGEVEFTPGLARLGRAVGIQLPLVPLHREAVERLRLLRDKAPRPRTEESNVIAQLLGLARHCLECAQYDKAATLAAQVLESGPVPEAHALYRDAEVRLTLALSDELCALDGRLFLAPLPPALPASLTADDLYLYSKLRAGRSMSEMLRTAPMGELAASRSVRRLMDAGLVRVRPAPGTPMPRRQTQPYGIPAAGT